MKERIEEKINAVVEYILSKPETAITPEEYGILANELVRLRNLEETAERAKRMAELVASTLSAPV